MPDESALEPPAPATPDAAEGEVDDMALQPDGPPAAGAAVPADTGYTPGGVPTFVSVREKIETRYGAAIGASELAAETPEGRTAEEQYDARARAAADRLAQIRESMRETEGDSQ